MAKNLPVCPKGQTGVNLEHLRKVTDLCVAFKGVCVCVCDENRQDSCVQSLDFSMQMDETEQL